MRAGVVNGGIPGAVATGSSGGSRSRSDFPSPSQCHVCRLRLTLPHQNLRDKMRPLEVVRSRRGARVDESTCLESMRLGNGTVGSNPTLSAIEQSPARLRRRVSWNCHRERTRWDSNEGDRRGDTPVRGETRGGGPPQWERVSATSNANPHPPSTFARPSPRESRGWDRYRNCNGAGPCATEPCEPRQVRKEATVSGSFCVPQDHLAPLLR